MIMANFLVFRNSRWVEAPVGQLEWKEETFARPARGDLGIPTSGPGSAAPFTMLLSLTKYSRLILAIACALAAGNASVAIAGGDPGAAQEQPAGIRQIESRRLTLVTDLPAGEEIDALPGYFDQAFGQWCAYFGVDEREHADWHVRCYLMKTPDHFRAAGLLPADVPEFGSGYTRGKDLWLLDQTSPYYRRHLLLHEGTHAFMYALVGAACSPWYFEGMAELLATHRLQDGKVTLGYFPRSRDEVPKLGRIEIVQTGYAARKAMTLTKIFAYDNRAHDQNEPYGWCWAAAAFLDGHPRYQTRFRQLRGLAGQQDFAEQAKKLFAADWSRLNEDWQLYVANLDYGYDFARMDVEPAAGKLLAGDSARVAVAADRGWQASGVQLEAGKTYNLRATGRYVVASEPRPWECEPGGVTIRYYHGQPLGILLAAVRADEPVGKDPSGLLKPLVVGLATTFKSPRTGTLYLRINDSAGSLADNSGSLNVEISAQEGSAGGD
jgi:hypothetical protein